jgi:3-isopropylmalate dehydratase small subunit
VTADWEEPLPTLTARAWAFGMALAPTDVLPSRYGDLPAREAARHVFGDLDAGLAARLAAGDAIVVDEVRGPVSSAPFAALHAAGVVAIVARRYDDGVDTAALAARVVPVALDAPAFVHTGDRVRIDLEAAKIVNLSSGDRAALRGLDDRRRAALRAFLLGRTT